MKNYKCFTVGRTDLGDGVEIAYDKMNDDISIATYRYSYEETSVCISEELLEKIAKYYNKKPYEVDDDDVAGYLVNIMKINEKDISPAHTFWKAW